MELENILTKLYKIRRSFYSDKRSKKKNIYLYLNKKETILIYTGSLIYTAGRNNLFKYNHVLLKMKLSYIFKFKTESVL